MTITLRSVKGSDLTHGELDGNFIDLEASKADAGAVTASGVTMSTARILGRATASTGAIEEITVGAGLTLAGGALSASGGGAATVTVKENGTNVSTAIATLDFLGADFDVTESPAGEANVVIAAAIARTSDITTHAALASSVHGITAAAATVLDDTTVAAMVNTLGGATSSGSGGLARVTSPTIATPTFSGLVTRDGADVVTPNAMGALAVDVTKYRNTKSVSADSTLTFSATASSGAFFGLHLTNSDSAGHVITIPSSFSMLRNATITALTIPASSQLWLVWHYDGTTYRVWGDPGANGLNNFGASTNPGVGDDSVDGYGPGSLWVNTTTPAAFVCITAGAGAADWNQIDAAGGGGDASTNTASSVDSEVAIFSGTAGKTLKRATGTGFASLTSGVLSVTNAASFTSGTATGITSFGLRNAGTGAFDMTHAHNGTLTAGRTLTWNLNDAARTVSLAGNLTLAGTLTTAAAFTQAGAFATTITATATSNFTLPAGTQTGAALGLAQSYTAAQRVTSVALTDGATINTDAALSNKFRVTLGGNRTLANPTNLADGQPVQWRVIQDATGSRTLAYGSAFKWPGGTAPTLTTAANAVDLICCEYDSTSATLMCNIVKDIK